MSDRERLLKQYGRCMLIVGGSSVQVVFAIVCMLGFGWLGIKQGVLFFAAMTVFGLVGAIVNHSQAKDIEEKLK